MAQKKERTSISADNRVVDTPNELYVQLKTYDIQKGWYVALGYAKTNTGLNKTNANRRPDNEEFGRRQGHWFINAYLDSEDYKTVGQPNIGKNGKPLKSLHKASNPFEREGVELVTFTNFRVRWKVGDYEDDCNRRRLIVHQYLSKPSRLARLTGSTDPEKNAYHGDAAAFAKKVLAYYSDKPEETVPMDDMTPELAADIWNYVKPNAGGTHREEDPKPKFNFYQAHPDPHITCDYYLVTPERGIEKVGDDFVRFWRREFGSAPKNTPDSNLNKILDRLVPGRFQSYLLSNVAYMVYTCKGNDTTDRQRLLYINRELNIDGKPNAAKRLMELSKIDKGQLSEGQAETF